MFQHICFYVNEFEVARGVLMHYMTPAQSAKPPVVILMHLERAGDVPGRDGIDPLMIGLAVPIP